MPTSRPNEPLSWLQQARPWIDVIIFEYRHFDLQFRGENRSASIKSEGPTPAEVIAEARAAAEALRTLGRFHSTMRSVQFGWDRMQVAEAASLHREVLTEILFGLQVRSAEDVPWHREQFAAAMPVFNPQAAIEYRDPFMGVFELIAANVDQIVDSYAGTLTRTRPTNNKLDRLIGRLGELWFQAEGEQPKAGSKEHQRPWPFERFVFAIWEEAEGERQADTKNRPPSRRLIKAALERWNAISSAA